MMMLLALDDEWLAYAGRSTAGPKVDPTRDGADPSSRLSRIARYSSLQQPCTVAWHPEHISLGVAAFEGDPRHASTLLERKLRAQGEISSDVKILILESQQVGRGYQVLYVTVALDEWQHMLSWAGSQQHICGLTLAAALAFKRVLPNRAVVLHVGRHFHFFARHDGQLIHLQAVSLDENLSDLEAVAAMLGGQAKAEMAARGCNQFNVVWVPGAFKKLRADLDTLSSAFGHAAHAVIEVDSELLGALDDVGTEVHSGLLELARHARPKDLLNQGEDKLQVLAREYLPYGAVAAVVAAIGLGYVGYGWVSEASNLRQRAQQLQADEATVRQSIAVIARDTALERPAVRGALGVNVGGDAMGSGGAEGSSGLRDSVTLTGGLGDDKDDVWSSLAKTLDNLLSEGDAKGGGAPAASASSTTPGAKADEPARFSMDRGSGSLYVRAKPSKVRAVAQMLEKGRAYRSRQVQIDAQLLDVVLNNDSQLGINWTSLGNRVMATVGASPTTIGQALGTVAQVPNLLGRSVTIPSQLMGTTGGTGGGITLSNKVFSATINALQSYGRVKVLSNPSIRVNNGVPAFMSVGTNFRYVKEITSVAATTSSGSGASGFVPMKTEVKTDAVFSGVVLGLGALVKENGEIELFVRPSQTQVDRESLGLVDVGDGARLTLPIVSTKSLTTMLHMRDGDVVLLGGLIAQDMANQRSGLPGLAETPGIGALFRSSAEFSSSRELVIIIRARIIQ